MSHDPQQLETLPNTFKQVAFDKIISLPNDCPSIEEIKTTTVTATITKQTTIPTSTGVSLEGQNLTGYKLVVEGTLNFDVVYEPQYSCQHKNISFKFKSPFTTFIILPESTLNSPTLRSSTVRGLIEYNSASKLNDRSIYASVIMLALADI